MKLPPSLLALAIASSLSFPLHAETPSDADDQDFRSRRGQGRA